MTYNKLVLDPAKQIKLQPGAQPSNSTEDTRGFMEKAFDYPECDVTYFFARNDIACGFFSNFGSDFITMIAIMVATILLTLLGLYLRKKGYIDETMPEPAKDAEKEVRKKYLISKICVLLTVTFGVKFFFAKMEGSSLNLMTFCFLNIFKANSSWQLGLGAFFSIIILLYFAVFLFFSWLFARYLKKDLEAHASSKLTRSFKRGEIKEVSKTHLIRFGFVSKSFDELRIDCTLIDLYLPMCLIIRDFFVSFFVVALSNVPVATPIMTAIIELFLFVYLLFSRARSKRMENVLDIFNCGCRITYGVLAAFSFITEKPNATIDVMMFITLIAMTLTTLFILAYIIILTVYDALSDGKCSQTFHAERYEASKQNLRKRLASAFVQYRKDVKKVLNEKPEDFKNKAEDIMNRSPKWRRMASTETKNTYIEPGMATQALPIISEDCDGENYDSVVFNEDEPQPIQTNA